MSVSDKVKFTKEGLLEIAGSRPVRAFSTPYEGDFRDVAPVEMSLKDYTDFLDQRDTSDEVTKNFSYVFERLPDNEGPLSFARSPPKLFKDQILLRSAQFTLGGQLMGSSLAVLLARLTGDSMKFRNRTVDQAYLYCLPKACT